jgi:hypothetical protein
LTTLDPLTSLASATTTSVNRRVGSAPSVYDQAFGKSGLGTTVVRFLEYSLQKDGTVFAFVNAYRQTERSLLTRPKLDEKICELSQRASPKDLSPYRSGELRFFKGRYDDPDFWAQLTGLKFNLISIDGRKATDLNPLAPAFDAVIQHALFDSDGFTLICLAPQSMARPEFKAFFENQVGAFGDLETTSELLDFGGVIRHTVLN